MRDETMKSVKPKAFKVYSFDVFDTVVTRTVGVPQAIFLLLGKKLSQSGLIESTPETFYAARISAEAIAWKLHHGQYEPTLAEIYLQLQEKNARELRMLHHWQKPTVHLLICRNVKQNL